MWRRCEDEKMWRWEGVKMWCEGVKMRRCKDVMWRWEDEKMWGCEDVRLWWGCEDVKMWRCEDEKMWGWEDVKMWCEDEKMWCEDEKMWRREDVKMRRCEDVMWSCEDVKMWCEDVMWRWEDVKMSRCENEQMWRCEDEKMWKCEDVKMWGCDEDVKIFDRPPLLEKPFAQTLSGKTCKSTSWSLIPFCDFCVVILWISCLNFFYAFSGPRNPRKKAHRREALRKWCLSGWAACIFLPRRRHLPCSAKAEGNHTTSANLVQ